MECHTHLMDCNDTKCTYVKEKVTPGRELAQWNRMYQQGCISWKTPRFAFLQDSASIIYSFKNPCMHPYQGPCVPSTGPDPKHTITNTHGSALLKLGGKRQT